MPSEHERDRRVLGPGSSRPSGGTSAWPRAPPPDSADQARERRGARRPGAARASRARSDEQERGSTIGLHDQRAGRDRELAERPRRRASPTRPIPSTSDWAATRPIAAVRRRTTTRLRRARGSPIDERPIDREGPRPAHRRPCRETRCHALPRRPTSRGRPARSRPPARAAPGRAGCASSPARSRSRASATHEGDARAPASEREARRRTRPEWGRNSSAAEHEHEPQCRAAAAHCRHARSRPAYSSSGPSWIIVSSRCVSGLSIGWRPVSGEHDEREGERAAPVRRLAPRCRRPRAAALIATRSVLPAGSAASEHDQRQQRLARTRRT